ncbi:MAG: amidase [Magnetovibrionaceae bacterium]
MAEHLSLASIKAITEALEKGQVSVEDVVSATLARIRGAEDQVQAWTYLDEDLALEQARGLDAARAQGEPMGPLFGVPVGIKDIIDTSDQPTQRGSAIYDGRQPKEDATVVSLLREAGAVILGKTVTTELAVFTPGKTRNPHNPDHTPGGSSSGSAAAVAAGMIPISVGTQTNGSMIRPGSFCGIYAFKPTHGRVSRHGVLEQSAQLDTVGVYARSLEDLAIAADAVMVHDSRDSSMARTGRPLIAQTMMTEPPLPPTFAFVRTPAWDQAEESTKDAFRELCEVMGDRVQIIDLPGEMDDVLETHRRIMEPDIAVSYASEYGEDGEALSPKLNEIIRRGQGVPAVDYVRAKRDVIRYQAVLDQIFHQFDAILTPSAPGEAPEGLDTTGNPAFCTTWTLTGTPAINLPVMEGPQGLPLGLQVVGPRFDDARLFRNARWLLGYLDGLED